MPRDTIKPNIKPKRVPFSPIPHPYYGAHSKDPEHPGLPYPACCLDQNINPYRDVRGKR